MRDKLKENMADNMKVYINTVIKPKVQGDGGDIDYVSFESGTLTVLLQGECSKCMIAHRCIQWVSEQIQKDLGQTVIMNVNKKKPYFWDV